MEVLALVEGTTNQMGMVVHRVVGMEEVRQEEDTVVEATNVTHPLIQTIPETSSDRDTEFHSPFSLFLFSPTITGLVWFVFLSPPLSLRVHAPTERRFFRCCCFPVCCRWSVYS